MMTFIAGIQRWVMLCLLICLLSACGGGSGSSSGEPGEPVLSFVATKIFRFNWTDVAGATHYKLLENPDGVSGFSQVGADIPQAVRTTDHNVPLYKRINAQYILQSCDAGGCTDSEPVAVSGTLAGAIGYFKASNTEASDQLGYAISLSADGTTLAIGAPGEDISVGAVYVFVRADGAWEQQAYIKASNAGEGSGEFGRSVSLSGDGDTLAVSAEFEASNATGIDGDETNTDASNAGAVYVFTRTVDVWEQQAYIKASNTGANDRFWSVSLSGDGDTLVVGAYREDSNATGIDGDGMNNDLADSGAVYVFIREAGDWSQQAYIKASNTGANDPFNDAFGYAISLSVDGNTLAVSASGENSNATGIDGDETNNDMGNAGAVYVFIREADVWEQQAYIKASNTGASDEFGFAISLSADGDTLAVGAFEDSNGIGIDGDQTNNSAGDAGAVYIFGRADGAWDQRAYIKASNTGGGDAFGWSVDLSGDGDTLAVGATGEDSNAIGINGDQTNSLAANAGAAYLY